MFSIPIVCFVAEGRIFDVGLFLLKGSVSWRKASIGKGSITPFKQEFPSTDKGEKNQKCPPLFLDLAFEWKKNMRI